MKNKEWLKEQIKHEEVDLKYAFDNYVPYEKVLIADDVNELLNQLEEPEQEKVVIPQFVADWIEECREMDVRLGESFNTHYEDNREIHTWIYNSDDKNSEIYARAWLDGYSVEEEKLYQVLDKEGYVMMRKYKGGVVRVNATMKPSEYPYWQKEKLGLTEQEIKDYDERYWAFAEEVTK